MEVKIKNIRLKGMSGGATGNHGTAPITFYARPRKVELVKVYPNFVLLDITTAIGEHRRECIDSADLYSGAIEIVDLNGNPINPWKDFFKDRGNTEEAHKEFADWTRCKFESDSQGYHAR